MDTIASQITSLTIVYSALYLGADQSKYQSSASLAFMWRIHRGPVNSPHKWPVTRKMSSFDDVIMTAGVRTHASSVIWGLSEGKSYDPQYQDLLSTGVACRKIIEISSHSSNAFIQDSVAYKIAPICSGLFVLISEWLTDRGGTSSECMVCSWQAVLLDSWNWNFGGQWSI